jgi:hypothetical protein
MSNLAVPRMLPVSPSSGWLAGFLHDSLPTPKPWQIMTIYERMMQKYQGKFSLTGSDNFCRKYSWAAALVRGWPERFSASTNRRAPRVSRPLGPAEGPRSMAGQAVIRAVRAPDDRDPTQRNRAAHALECPPCPGRRSLIQMGAHGAYRTRSRQGTGMPRTADMSGCGASAGSSQRSSGSQRGASDRSPACGHRNGTLGGMGWWRGTLLSCRAHARPHVGRGRLISERHPRSVGGS